MSRPEKNRKIGYPPLMKGFRPYGLLKHQTGSIQLTFEEYESIRLVSYEMLPQKDAAIKMNVSRPTLTRIYNKAIKNISKAFIEGKRIEIEGGNYELENDWFRCRKCHKLIEGIQNHSKCGICKDFSQEELINLNN